MTQKTIYGSDGMIVRVVTLTGDPVDDAIIEDIPVGGASVDGYYDSDTVYFVAGVATARPAVVVDPAYEIVADGEDSFWFEVPDETHISTSEGYFDATITDALVSVSSRLIGPQRILVVPPLPYQKTAIMVSVVPDDGGAPNLPPTTPDIEILFSQTVLTNLAVLAKPKFNVVSWDISSDPEHAYYGLTRYESEADADADTAGIDIEPITDTFYKDADEFVNGVDCWYRVYDVDTNDNRSEKSDPAGEVARGVQEGDVEDDAITPRKASLGNLSNLVKDGQLTDPTLCTASGGTGPTITPHPNDAAALGPSINFYRVTSALAIGQALTLALPLSPCFGGRRISFNCYVKRYLPASTFSVTMYVDWYTLDSSGDPDFLSTDATSYTVSMTSGSLIYTFPMSLTSPATAVFFAIRMVTAVAGSATTYGFDFGGVYAIESNYGVYETSEPSGTIVVPPSTSFSQIMGHTSNHTGAASRVRLFAGFTNVSGGSRTIDIFFYKNGVALFALAGITLANNQDWSREYSDNNALGASDAYSCRISTGGSAFTADYRYFVTDARFG